MGNELSQQLNCCKNNDSKDTQLQTHPNEGTSPKDNGNNIKKDQVARARANNRFLISDDDTQGNAYDKVNVSSKNQFNIDMSSDNLNRSSETNPKTDIKKILDIKKSTIESKDSKKDVNKLSNTINKEVNREQLLSQFEKERIVNREKDFPRLTQEYIVSKSKYSSLELKELFPKESIIYDNGTLIVNKSFYFGERNTNLKRHGYGTLVLCDGSKFSGYWVNNEFSLFGRHIDTDLTIYEGEFQNGLLHGQGEEITLNSKYTGTFVTGEKEGQGVLETETEIYEGDFVNNKKQGKGRIRFTKTSNYYEGDFSNGKIEGNGTFRWVNGDIYEGAFQNGILHDTGIYKWVNGDVYEGNYSNGTRSGKGRLTNSNGKVYEGEFFNNYPHGKGVIIKDGKTSEVEFNNGAPLKRKNSTMSKLSEVK